MLQISGAAGEQQANPDQGQKRGRSESRTKKLSSSAMVYTMALCFLAAVLAVPQS